MKPFRVLVPADQRSTDQSGLTGPANIPDPPRPQGRRDLRSRLLRLRRQARETAAGFPRVLRLVWVANPRLAAGLAVAAVVSGVVPAASAFTGRLVVNTVVQAVRLHAEGLPDRIVLAVPLPGLTWRLPGTTAAEVIVALAIVQITIYGASSLAGAVRNVAQQVLQEQVTVNVELMIMEHASRLDVSFFEGSSSYDLLRRAEKEATVRPVSMISTAFGLIQSAVTFASMIALLVGLSPLLAAITLIAPVPAFIADSRYGWRSFLVARWASPIRRRMEYLAMLVTTDTYAKEVRLFGLGDYFVDRFRLLGQAYVDRQHGLVKARYTVGAAWGMLTTLVGSLTYLYVALQAVAGRLTLGDLTLYAAAASSVQTAFQGLLQGLASLYESSLYLSNLFELLATPADALRPASPRPLPRPLRGRVSFDRVSFAYPGADRQALRDVSFEIVPAETVAFVGPNGAGKSTLVKLLCRLYDPTEGRILIDGVDIREVDPIELRAAIGTMFQDYVTYQATAAENIGLGDVARIEDRPRIEEAAMKAGAHSLIERLPAGYGTPLGKWFDQGVNLSGGEWQKVALARAFMRTAPILVLDEPTAALDAQAEYELFGRLRLLAEGRTTVYVSHRFSTVRQADRIIFLEEGQLVEAGTHEELMGLEGRYAQLFSMQASAYNADTVGRPSSR